MQERRKMQLGVPVVCCALVGEGHQEEAIGRVYETLQFMHLVLEEEEFKKQVVVGCTLSKERWCMRE